MITWNEVQIWEMCGDITVLIKEKERRYVVGVIAFTD